MFKKVMLSILLSCVCIVSSGTVYACSLEEQERILYIKNLNLPEYIPEKTPLKQPLISGKTPIESESEKGYVNKGSLVSFVSGVDAQTQSDVLNSTLLAQLAANKLYDHDKDTENWYKKYREVLSNVGWVIENFQFSEHDTRGKGFTVDKVIIELLSSIATGNELDVAKKTLEALQGLNEQDGRFVLFSQSSHSDKNGNFQISAVSQSGNVPVMKLGAFHFTADSIDTQFLWFNYDSKQAHIYKGSQQINLNLDVYQKLRETIVSKLGDRAQKYIGDLDI